MSLTAMRCSCETGAGAGIGADDNAYRAAGAQIARTAEEVFAKSDMIVKVKEPQPSEWVQLREGQILYTYLHLAPDPEQTRGLVESGVTAVAYETVTDERGGLPLLAPMSEVAGRLAIQAGATALQKADGGRGVLLGGVPGVLPGKVVVIGGGVVGLNAAKMAVGLGADVTIIDRSIPRLRQLDDIFNGRVHTRYSTVQALEDECFSADVVVGAVLIPGAAAPKLVSREMLTGMKQGAVHGRRGDRPGRLLRDLARDHPFRPDLQVDGIVHYCVANMPGAVPVTSAHALNNATLYLRAAARRQGTDGAGRRPASEERPQRAPGPHHQPRRGRGARLRNGRAAQAAGGLTGEPFRVVPPARKKGLAGIHPPAGPFRFRRRAATRTRPAPGTPPASGNRRRRREFRADRCRRH